MPSPARMYNYFLGGKHNLPVDREAADRVLAVVPEGRALATANRRFLMRAVRFLARQGIRQFIELGAGIPAGLHVHEAARFVAPDARIVYVDNDPVATLHMRTLLADADEDIFVLNADIRYPLGIMSNYAVLRVIDFSQPVAVLATVALHFLADEESPRKVIEAFTDRMASGSYLVISHATGDGAAPDVLIAVMEACANVSAHAVFRTRHDIGELFAGLDLLQPGLVEVAQWRGNNRKPAHPPQISVLGGVGRKR